MKRLLVLTLGLAAIAPPLLRAAEPPAVPDTLDLATAITFAVENNFAIRQARERIQQQEGVRLEVSARRIPNVAASGALQANTESLSQSFPASDRSWSLAITASQTVFSGGAVRASVRSSELARDAAVLDLEAVVNDALFSVRRGFYDVLLARERVKVQEQNIELLQRQLRTATDRFETGAISSFEKLRAEVALANSQVPLITARNSYRLAIESLRQSLGFTTNTPESLRRVPEFIGALQFAPAQFDLQAALTAARANRPELKRLQKLADASEQGVAAARAGYLPSVAVVGGWQLRKGGSNSITDSDTGAYLGVQSQWNIFDGRATLGRVRQALAAQAQSRLRLAETQLATDVEVRTAYSDYQEGVELAEAAQKVVAQADEALRVANSRYEAGSATQLDVLQSQVDLTTARTNQVQANYAFNVAVARLRKAMGIADEFVK